MRPIEILLVEDNAADIRLTIEALKEGKITNNLHISEDGEDALDFVFQRNKHKNAVRPDLILLDLNLPKINGKEVLNIIKSTEILKRIPIIVLSTSSSESDITKSYENHANCYITKPIGFENFMNIIKTIEEFWFTIVKLPDNVKS